MVLAVGCFVGDIVELVSYNTVSGGGGGTLNNIVEDTTPQLGGNLDLFNKTITGTGGINMTGVVTATSFIGNGSGLTGVVASGTGVVVKNSGSTVGTAGTINFGDNLSVSPASAGIVTITGFSGITTISGVVSIANDLDVDGHTNLDNVSIAGVTTFSGDVTFTGASRTATWDSSEDSLVFNDNAKLAFGNGSKATIRHSGSQLFVNNDSGNLYLRVGNENGVLIVPNSSVRLYHNGNQKFETTAQGIEVTGHSELDNVNIAGVVTATTNNATTFVGNGDFVELDVDGHTELDNVNIAGVVTATTFKGALQATSGTFSSNILSLIHI